MTTVRRLRGLQDRVNQLEERLMVAERQIADIQKQTELTVTRQGQIQAQLDRVVKLLRVV